MDKLCLQKYCCIFICFHYVYYIIYSLLVYLLSERRIASFLGAIGQEVLSMYRSCGTYIAFMTILLTVYLVTPNYVSFGYIFLLLVWITGRQLVEKTKRRLWFPLKVYSLLVFLFIYSLSICSQFEMWLSRVLDLYPNLGYNPEASLLKNVWESLAIVIVMQLYSYERRQSKYNRLDAPHPAESGMLAFVRRLLIWHSHKILFVAVFYASLSPVSAFGFVYLLGLVIFSTLPKVSQIPSKVFLVYTGFLVMTEYLFQLWGKQAEMFPGQKHSYFSLILGFCVFKPGFSGIESGLRGKVLVIAACTLQYNVFHWLDKMPSTLLSLGKWEEPCPLFISEDETLPVYSEVSKPASDSSSLSTKKRVLTSSSWPSFNFGLSQESQPVSSEMAESGGSDSRKFSFGKIWGSTKESHKWNKKRILALKKERFETQKTMLKIYFKFWMENMFNLFGLEINMIALLLASFALSNAISMLYIAALAACVLLNRHIIWKLWPIFIFLFASILTLEYLALWKSMVSLSPDNQSDTNLHCHDCWRSSDLYFHFCRNCWLGITLLSSLLIIYVILFLFSALRVRKSVFSSPYLALCCQ